MMYQPIERLESRRMLSAVNGVFAVTAGGAGKDRGNDIAVDSAGNTLLAGVYNGPVDFDPSAASVVLPGSGSDDAFVAKYGPSGQLMWAKAVTGVSTQEIQSVAVDSAGSVYCTGYFDSTVDFDPGVGVHPLTSRGGEDAFLLKLSSAGNFLWVRQFGGKGSEGGVSVTTDRIGYVYVQGMFNGTGDYGLSPGAAVLSTAGGFDDFILKLNTAGSVAFAKKIGGAGNEFANGITIDPAGSVITTGTFTSAADFDPGAGTAWLSSAGSTDVFVSKLSSTGAFVFARRIGGAGADTGGDVRTDSAGSIYVAGQFTGTADFDPGAGTVLMSSAGSADAFVMRLNSYGVFAWARRFGSAYFDEAADLALDSAGNVYLTGTFAGTVDFDPGAGVYALSSYARTQDIYVAKLSSAGTFVWAVGIGGASSIDEGQGIVAGPGGVYVGGAFGGGFDFDPGTATKFRAASGVKDDAFVLRMTAS